MTILSGVEPLKGLNNPRAAYPVSDAGDVPDSGCSVATAGGNACPIRTESRLAQVWNGGVADFEEFRSIEGIPNDCFFATCSEQPGTIRTERR